MSLNCPSCGRLVSDMTKFCPDCGCKLHTEVKVQAVSDLSDYDDKNIYPEFEYPDLLNQSFQ